MNRGAPAAAGWVLAGGRSSRMGQEKALVELEGRPLIAHALDVLVGAGLEPRIAGARPDLSQFAPVIADEQADRGPLGGVVSALEQTAQDWAVFVSIDMPLMAPELVEFLIEDARLTGAAITLTAVNGFAETFPVVVRRETLETLRERLEQGEGGCFAAFEAAARERGEKVRAPAVEVLAEASQVTDARGLRPWQWFLNVNTRDDLKAASAALGRPIA
ncbi:MAG: molybdenum cofactor guanylyltransferase [Terracidiphilus sp.]